MNDTGKHAVCETAGYGSAGDYKEDHSLIVTMEENVKSGGFGEQVMTYYGSRLHSPAVRIVAIEDKFVPHGSVEDLMHQQQMDSASVTERVLQWQTK